jgi:hypothetical protein
MEGAMSDRNYIVHYKGGSVAVLVREAVIQLRGERQAVAQAAWFKLMGQNELGEDVDKKLLTRKILITQMLSTYEPYRYRIYEEFESKIKFTWIGIVREQRRKP